MTVLEREMMEAIIRIADEMSCMNKQIQKQNEMLETLIAKTED